MSNGTPTGFGALARLNLHSGLENRRNVNSVSRVRIPGFPPNIKEKSRELNAPRDFLSPIYAPTPSVPPFVTGLAWPVWAGMAEGGEQK